MHSCSMSMKNELPEIQWTLPMKKKVEFVQENAHASRRHDGEEKNQWNHNENENIKLPRRQMIHTVTRVSFRCVELSILATFSTSTLFSPYYSIETLQCSAESN